MHRTLIALSFALVAGAASAATLQETVDRTFDVRPGALVSLQSVNGHIAVRAWDEPRVRVHAEKHVRGSSDRAKEVMSQLRIDMVPSADGLRITTNFPKHDDNFLGWLSGDSVDASVDFEVTVPRTMNLHLHGTNGAIEVDGVSGSHQVATTNGRIELARCAGDLDAETTNGSIRAQLLGVTPGKSIRLETTNGAISLAAPATLAAHVEAATTNGSINTELPITTTHVKRNELRGDLNGGGGGAELRLHTTNGSINIRRAQ